MAVGVRRKKGLHRNTHDDNNDNNGGKVDDVIITGQRGGDDTKGVPRRKRPSQYSRWEATGQLFAVKEMDWQKIEDGRCRMTEDPINEVRAMQYFTGWYHAEEERRRSRRRGRATANTEESEGEGEEESAYDAAVRIMGETNVIVPVDVLTDDKRLYIVTPLCEGGDLFGLVERNNGRDAVFTEAVARALFTGILNGMDHLRRAGLAHRDISLENVLVNRGSCVIVDLGQCVRVPHRGNGRRYLMSNTDDFGKSAYRPPESWIEGGAYDGYAADLWMMSIVLINLLSGRHPWDQAVFYGDKYFKLGCCREQLAEAFEMRGNMGKGLSEECLDLLQGCLRWDPRRRLGIRGIQAHPWMLGITQQVPGLRCDDVYYRNNAEERSCSSCRDEGPGADCRPSYLRKQAV